MSLNIHNRKKLFINLFGLVVVIAVAMMVAGPNWHAAAAEIKQKNFQSSEEAVKALIEAARGDDTKELLTIFGPAGKEIIFSGDEVADKEGRRRFVEAFEKENKLVNEGDKKVILCAGSENWPFPIPLIKKGQVWVFDTMAGREELLNRRIGRNELNTIQVCLAYVDAQREYALKDRDSDKVLEYAQKFISEKGTKDGLYWETKEGEEESPMGEFFAKAMKEGYTPRKAGEKPRPYQGYYYKILKAQGKNAPGGAYDYVVRGKMIGGFALIAYPAEYRNSGVMTFVVNHDGVVYQKDLGRETEKIAGAMKKYDPDKTWKKVE